MNLSDFIESLKPEFVKELDTLVQECDAKSLQELYDDDEYTIFNFVEEKTKLHVIHNSDYGCAWIGRDFSSIKDDETGKQFKDGVIKTLQEIFPDSVIEDNRGTYEESWYNG